MGTKQHHFPQFNDQEILRTYWAVIVVRKRFILIKKLESIQFFFEYLQFEVVRCHNGIQNPIEQFIETINADLGIWID